jgi:peptidyl-tRNA hydrolase, PTH1 family
VPASRATAGTPAEQAIPDDRWLIIGLGNPGPEYAGNRHNVGFMCADLLATQIGSTFKRDRSRAMAANGRLGGVPVTLAKPLSFMNLSGGAVASLRAFYKLPAERILVMHDELDLPFDTIRLKLGGGDNGHNGLRSVTAALGTRDYHRLRIGIGRPPGRMDPADFVLRNFSPAERKELPDILGRSADAVETLLTRGLAAAQNAFHSS